MPSTLGLFSVPKTQKYCSEDNFFVRAKGCAIELLKLNVNKTDMPLGKYRIKKCIFLAEEFNHFNIAISCSHFVKCFCKIVALKFS